MSELNLPDELGYIYDWYIKRVEEKEKGIQYTGHFNFPALGKVLTALSEARDELHKKDCIIGDLVKEKAEACDEIRDSHSAIDEAGMKIPGNTLANRIILLRKKVALEIDTLKARKG